MAKTRRLLQDQLKRVDLVIEVCDARLPFSSRNPELLRMTAGKRRILLLNKADLADPEATRRWVRFFQARGETAYPVHAISLKSKELLGTIDRSVRDVVETAEEKGIRKTIRVMVIGVPNVGKSTLINRLRGTSIAKTGDRPGVTKGNQWIHVAPYLDLMDTPGMLWPRLDDQLAARRLCYIGSVKDDVVDIYALAISLLEDLKASCPETLSVRFHVEDLNVENVELLDAVCRGRGWLLRGGRFDYDRCCNVVLDEFRSGKLGKITLELPDAQTGEAL
ncbi:ribosome biogenesis GTPase YlqF [Clostridiales bacterium]|nr:ribosome biogenesis GTPase YlqF [Clostridiales bacterium]